MRRRVLAQEMNEYITKLNQELQEKLQAMEKEYPRLQRRSQAMDGLTMLLEATRHIQHSQLVVYNSFMWHKHKKWSGGQRFEVV